MIGNLKKSCLTIETNLKTDLWHFAKWHVRIKCHAKISFYYMSCNKLVVYCTISFFRNMIRLCPYTYKDLLENTGYVVNWLLHCKRKRSAENKGRLINSPWKIYRENFMKIGRERERENRILKIIAFETASLKVSDVICPWKKMMFLKYLDGNKYRYNILIKYNVKGERYFSLLQIKRLNLIWCHKHFQNRGLHCSHFEEIKLLYF